ncbi:tetratricopeptide repeat protein [Nocardia sp. CA-290969]
MAEVEAPPGIDNIASRPGEFVGRDTELDTLTTVFAGPGSAVVAAVHGLGGIGKSTLVAHWAATRPHGFAPIVWITADTSTNLTTGLVEFATRLQPVLAEVVEDEQLADRALQWLATHTGWLLVLDNADDLNLVAPVLARAGNGGRVVITSRRATGWQPGTTIVRLDVLEPAESMRLLTALLHTNGRRDTDGAAQLCAELGHLPLAIRQSGAYLAQDPFLTPSDYLRLLAEHPAETFGQGDVDTDSERTIARIWRITLDRIAETDPAAVDLLRTLAWYAPESIPLVLCHEPGLDPPKHRTALGLLSAYNMITPDPATGTVSVHRLVQAVARTPDLTDPHRQPDTIERARIRATETLYSALPDREDPGMWPTWRTLLPHIDALTSRTTSGSDSDSTTVVAVVIRNHTGVFLYGQGLHAGALDHLQHALTDSERVLGAEHPGTLGTRHNLASAYQAAGRVAEAIPLYERTLTDSERVLGAEHPGTLGTRNNLALAYQVAGRVAEAIPLHERALTDRERVLGAEHPDTLTSRINLASAYQDAGRVAEAIPLLERTLTDSERVLGAEHPDTLGSRHHLALAYQVAGRVAEAIPLYERALTDRERVLGVEHPGTLTSRNNLALTYQVAGRVAEAIPLLERTLTDSERVLGVEHPGTLGTRNNLALAYRVAGRVAEAIPLYERTLTDSERIPGAEHPHTLTSRNNLAVAYHAAGRVAEAIPLLERTLTDRQRVLGIEHPDTLGTRNNLAYAYRSAGRVGEAVTLFERALADSEQILGSEHPTNGVVRTNLATVRQWAR